MAGWRDLQQVLRPAPHDHRPEYVQQLRAFPRLHAEHMGMRIGATAQNITNTEIFGNPNTSINSTSFGRITSSALFSNAGVGTSSPARIVVLQGRITF